MKVRLKNKMQGPVIRIRFLIAIVIAMIFLKSMFDEKCSTGVCRKNFNQGPVVKR